MTPEDRYYASSDEGEIRRLRSDLEHARGQLKHWQYLKEHYSRQAHAFAEERAQLAKLIDCAWSAQCGQCLNAAHALLEDPGAADGVAASRQLPAGGRELEDYIGAAPHLAESMEDGADG